MNLKFFCFSILLVIVFASYAQDRSTIVDELTRNDYSGGTVSISGDLQVNTLLGKPLRETTALNETSVKIPGYRIQAFSGNQQQSKAEAFTKAKDVKDLFPEISTYVKYNAPVWRLRIGDFQTSEEATNFMKDLKKKLPSLGREMYIVTDEIVVTL